eukprot:6464706-Amphidinium_carterae.1
MPTNNKDDRVRKDKKEKSRTSRRGSTGTELVSESEVGTPARKDDHGGRDCASGVATVIPPQPAVVVPSVGTEQRPMAPRTMADDEPLTKADLAAMQQGLALMLQAAVSDGISGLQRAQERQGARLSALEESQRSLADKLKKLEGQHAVRAASVPPAGSNIFAPRVPASD